MVYERRFTVFTPSYNRAHTLGRVYESLLGQTFKDFEWLVVDDGSEDDTRELVESWLRDERIDIRYLRQPNRGKHRARNRAVQEARGELFVTVDSDDEVLPMGLQLLNDYWLSIPDSIRSRFSGITGLCLNASGKLMGSRFPADVFDTNMFDIRVVHRVTGGKFGFQKTAVMREFRFPEIEGESFVPEALVWFRIARKYKTRFINESLYVYHKTGGGLAASWVGRLVNSPKGRALYFNECLARDAPTAFRVKAAVNYIRCSMHAGVQTADILASSNGGRAMTAVSLPLAYLLYARDRAHHWRQQSRPGIDSQPRKA